MAHCWGFSLVPRVYSVGHFPVWPAKVSAMHVTWRYTSNDLSGHTSTVATTIEEDNGPESVSVDAISYVGEASHHDIEFVDDHTVLLHKTWSTTSETAADAAVPSGDSQVTSSYGRIEYSDGLVYEGECCTMQPHGWVSSSFPAGPPGHVLFHTLNSLAGLHSSMYRVCCTIPRQPIWPQFP